MAAGAILAALAGAGVGSALGGIAGGLVGMGIPEYEAKRYEGLISTGGTPISINCASSEQRDTAKKILVTTGAQDVPSASASSASSDSSEGQTRIAKEQAF